MNAGVVLCLFNESRCFFLLCHQLYKPVTQYVEAVYVDVFLPPGGEKSNNAALSAINRMK